MNSLSLSAEAVLAQFQFRVGRHWGRARLRPSRSIRAARVYPYGNNTLSRCCSAPLVRVAFRSERFRFWLLCVSLCRTNALPRLYLPEAVRFRRFAARGADKLAPWVQDWVTFNEPMVFLVGAYAVGWFPGCTAPAILGGTLFGIANCVQSVLPSA